MQPLTLTLPLPPSTNNLFAGAGRRRRKSEGYQKWLTACDADYLQGNIPRGRFTGPVSISLTYFPGKGWRNFPGPSWLDSRDGDNMEKAVLDWLVLANYLTGDSWRWIRASKRTLDPTPQERAGVRVTITPWEENT